MPGLHVPLMALIDYKGFRMSAQAFLPLKGGPGAPPPAAAGAPRPAAAASSLVLGSHDAGRTVACADARALDATRDAARALGLKRHAARGVHLWTAVDVEARARARARR